VTAKNGRQRIEEKFLPFRSLTQASAGTVQLASCLIYAWALLEYVTFIVWVRSVTVREIRGK